MKALIIGMFAAALAFAQSKTAGAGHWEGAVETPGGSLTMHLDLDRTDQGVWVGDLDIPAQGAKDMPVDKLKVEGNKVSFEIPGAPGGATIAAEVSADGKSMKGTLSQGGADMPVSFQRISEPKVVVPAKSPAMPKEFEGVWQGALAAPDGNKLRCRVTLANTADGATGKFNSLDQTNTDLPIQNIAVTGKKLSFDLKMVNGKYEGELTPEGKEIKGTWSQGMFAGALNLAKQ